MGLYERLLQERAKEERRRGGPLPPTRRSGSKVLDRRMGNPPKDRPPGYAADLSTLHRLMTEGPRGQGDAYRFHGLKARYREEYAELKAEARGQGELL
jgi:hypothetical protein